MPIPTRKPLSILGDSWSGDGTSMTATYNTKLTAAALDAGKEVDSCASSGQPELRGIHFAGDDAVTAVSSAMPKAGPVSPDQPAFFHSLCHLHGDVLEQEVLHGGTRDVSQR